MHSMCRRIHVYADPHASGEGSALRVVRIGREAVVLLYTREAPITRALAWPCRRVVPLTPGPRLASWPLAAGRWPLALGPWPLAYYLPIKLRALPDVQHRQPRGERASCTTGVPVSVCSRRTVV